MNRITVYRRRMAVRFWLASTADEQLRKAYTRLVDAESRR